MIGPFALPHHDTTYDDGKTADHHEEKADVSDPT